MKHLLGLALIFVTTQAYAKITIKSVSNASRRDDNIIYGGYLGNNTSGSSTTNSCNDGNVKTACNKKEIGEDTELEISFVSDSTGGTAKLVESDEEDTLGDSDSVSKGETATITVNWSVLCPLVDTDATDCSDANSKKSFRLAVDDGDDGDLEDTLTISIVVRSGMPDTNVEDDDDGIYDFELFRGDEKAFITGIDANGSSFPSNSTGGTFEKAHFFYVEVDDENDPCASIATITGDDESFETDFDEDGDEVTVKDNLISGLENGKTYGFSVALEDDAGNIGLFNADSTCDEENHVVTPDDVFGVLDEGQNCFIATAAFGNAKNPIVMTLRKFRSRVLLKFPFGKWMVKTYYKYSPTMATWIRDNRTLQIVAQVFVAPFAAIAFLILNWKYSLAAILMILILAIKRSRKLRSAE
ncbi:MAG: hypothetical protein KDD25_02190 [Bdellovibrionales bacterium]|nr:hypothetical protein [Bdellovibrionales bacterium]